MSRASRSSTPQRRHRRVRVDALRLADPPARCSGVLASLPASRPREAMPASGGPTCTCAPVTPGIRWQALQAYWVSATRPRAGSAAGSGEGGAGAETQASPTVAARNWAGVSAGSRSRKATVRPEVGVRQPVFPGRHAAHLDALLHHPVELGRAEAPRRVDQGTGQRLHAAADLALRDAGAAVADQALVAIAERAAGDQRRVVEAAARRCRRRGGGSIAGRRARAASTSAGCAAPSPRCRRGRSRRRRRRRQRRPTASAGEGGERSAPSASSACPRRSRTPCRPAARSSMLPL